MLPYLQNAYGNPTGSYTLAKQAARALEEARRDVARLLEARPQEVVFAGNGTRRSTRRSRGWRSRSSRRGWAITLLRIEHHAVLHSCAYMKRFGFETTYVPVDKHGLVDPDAIGRAVNERTVLVSVMLANNEVGTIEPVADIARAMRQSAEAMKRRVPVHTNAVQRANALELSVEQLGVDLLSLSAHKFCGSKGIGVLYLRRGTPFLPQESGGGQERQRRAGTENVAGIVGTAVALREAQQNREVVQEDRAERFRSASWKGSRRLFRVVW